MAWGAVISAVGGIASAAMSDGGEAPEGMSLAEQMALQQAQARANRRAYYETVLANRPEQQTQTGTIGWEVTDPVAEWTDDQMVQRSRMEQTIEMLKNAPPDSKRMKQLQAALDRANETGNAKKIAKLTAKLQKATEANTAATAKKLEEIQTAYATMKMEGRTPRTYKQITKLAEPLKEAQDAAMEKQRQLADALKNQGAFSGDPRVQWDAEGGNKYADKLYAQATERLRPEFQRDEEMLHTRLVNQGLQPGTEAYDRAMKTQRLAQSDSLTKAAMDASVGGQSMYLQDLGAQQGLQQGNWGQQVNEYNMPFDQILKSQAYSSANTPNAPGFSTPGSAGFAPANYSQAANSAYQSELASYSINQQNAANRGQAIAGAFQAVGDAYTDYQKAKLKSGEGKS